MIHLIEKNLQKRYLQEKRFKIFGLSAILFSLIFLIFFLSAIFIRGNQAFFTHKILIEIDFAKENLIANSQFMRENQILEEGFFEKISYQSLIRQALKQKFPQSKSKKEIHDIYKIVSDNADFELKNILEENPQFIGLKKQVWLSVSSKVDVYLKYKITEQFDEQEISRIDILLHNEKIQKFFNFEFFKYADSREPESAGIAASLIGSFLVMIVFLICAFPIAVMCAFYLEEFAPKNKFTDLIEISINNLAAIPSIIYGLLGLTLYLQIMELPRSSALVGGMTLFMLVLPVVIISTRNAIRVIPSSIRDGAIALGASKMQVILHHLFPLSIPGIMTGTILAMSRALGETAPLLMIGMVAFIADVPRNFFDPTTVLPVQIYLWSDSPEIGFASKTAAAILVLLGFLIIFNLIAIILRKKFEKKW